MTESLRERCIEAGVNVIKTMALVDENSRDYKIQTMNLILDTVLDVLEESADEIPATITQKAWRCLNCGTDHGEAGCGEPLPVLWRAFAIDDLLAVLRGNGE